MVVVFIADCLTTQRAGIHVYVKGLIPFIIDQYPHHTYYHITTKPYSIDCSSNVVIPIKSWLPAHYRLRYFVEIPSGIKRLKADVAIETAHFGPFIMADHTVRMTVVHDLTPILFPHFHDWLSSWWHRVFFGRLLRSTDAIITNSYATKKDIVEYLKVAPRDISVCYPQLTPPHNKKDQSKSDSITFLTLGTIEPRKNHQLILIALTKWYKLTGRNFEWWIVGGEGWKNNDFHIALQGSSIKPFVKITGYVNDQQKSEIYDRSDVLLFASFYEGFGIPIVEAMDYGLVAILSNIAIHREVGGDQCHFFDDADGLTELLTTLELQTVVDYSDQLRLLREAKIDIPILGKRGNKTA